MGMHRRISAAPCEPERPREVPRGSRRLDANEAGERVVGAARWSRRARSHFSPALSVSSHPLEGGQGGHRASSLSGRLVSRAPRRRWAFNRPRPRRPSFASASQSFPTGGKTQHAVAVPASSHSATHKGARVRRLSPIMIRKKPFAIGSVTPAEFEYTAEGKARLLNTVTMEPELPECNWVWSPSAKETSTVTYKNSAPTKTVEADRVSTMTLNGSGSLCGLEETKATWTEHSVFSLEGGTLKWE